MFGIEEIGVQLEEPLSSMPLEDTVARIEADTRQASILGYINILIYKYPASSVECPSTTPAPASIICSRLVFRGIHAHKHTTPIFLLPSGNRPLFRGCTGPKAV